ncbi:MAG: hypothetical protein SGBAC_007870 [Bacillariaceae sp.]
MNQIFYFNDEEAEPPLEVKHVVIDASQLHALPDDALSRRPELIKVEFQNADEDSSSSSSSRSSRLIAIGDRAFDFCTSLHSIFRMPSTLERIGQAAFQLCSTVGYVHLPDGIQVIGEGAFESCVSLLTIRIPSTVQVIERATFRDCRQLRSVELPPTLESVGGVAFFGCLELVNIYLPESVNVEGVNLLFTGCTKLEPLAQQRLGDDTMSEAIVSGLRSRFRNLPIHKFCYYQSYQTLEENLDGLKDMVNMQFYDFDQHVDDLGMNPFHILSLSAEPKAMLAEALADKVVKANMALDRLRRRCLCILKCRFCWWRSSSRTTTAIEQDHVPRLLSDAQGNGALLYACLNIAPRSTEMIKCMFRLNASRDLPHFGLKRWREEAFRLIDRELDNENNNTSGDNEATTTNVEEDDSNFDLQNRFQKIDTE